MFAGFDDDAEVPTTKCDLGAIIVPDGKSIVPPLDSVLPGFAFGLDAVARV
jgi:hypothetical protein